MNNTISNHNSKSLRNVLPLLPISPTPIPLSSTNPLIIQGHTNSTQNNNEGDVQNENQFMLPKPINLSLGQWGVFWDFSFQTENLLRIQDICY